MVGVLLQNARRECSKGARPTDVMDEDDSPSAAVISRTWFEQHLDNEHLRHRQFSHLPRHKSPFTRGRGYRRPAGGCDGAVAGRGQRILQNVASTEAATARWLADINLPEVWVRVVRPDREV